VTLLTALYEPTLTPSAGGYLPSLEDVSALLHARLRERGGAVPDTFTTSTEPTAGQVLRIIGQEASMVLIDTGSLAPDKLVCAEASTILDAVRTLIAKRVAAAARECRLGEVEPGDEQQAATSPSYQFDVYGGETFADRFVKPMNRRW
jgi:hypothetical protein